MEMGNFWPWRTVSPHSGGGLGGPPMAVRVNVTSTLNQFGVSKLPQINESDAIFENKKLGKQFT